VERDAERSLRKAGRITRPFQCLPARAGHLRGEGADTLLGFTGPTAELEAVRILSNAEMDAPRPP